MKVRKPQLLHYDAILFDVDGTLIDSAPGILHTLEEVFQKMGVDVTGVNLRRYLGPPLRKSFGEHFTELDKIEQATCLYRESYAVKGSHECAAYPGAAEMLQRLKDAGLILCTATSKPTEVVTPILEEKGLAPFFDFIGGASMDESRDTKTDVVRYVLSQPMLQGILSGAIDPRSMVARRADFPTASAAAVCDLALRHAGA
ncbi:MAG: HAD family hydrolase [Faecalibacterium sp.]|nr:HAD family hydrolase [Faecalibacterium sp.]